MSWNKKGQKSDECRPSCPVTIHIMYEKEGRKYLTIIGKWSKDSEGQLTVTLDGVEVQCDPTEKGFCKESLPFLTSNFSRENPPYVVSFESKDKDGNEINFTWPDESSSTTKPKPKPKYAKYFYIGLALVTTIGLVFGLWVCWDKKCRKKKRKKGKKEKAKRMDETTCASSLKTSLGTSGNESQSRNLSSVQTVDSTTGLNREGEKAKSFKESSESSKSSPGPAKKHKHDVRTPGNIRRTR